MSRIGAVPISTVIRENGKLAVLYLLGGALLALIRWPLGLLYLGYCGLSMAVFVIQICPYCRCYHAKCCPNAYHVLAGLKPENAKFADQFRRYVPVTYAAWGLPVLAGLYLVIKERSWPILVLWGIFGAFAFVVFPRLSGKVCLECSNARNCPRHRGWLSVTGRDKVGETDEK